MQLRALGPVVLLATGVGAAAGWLLWESPAQDAPPGEPAPLLPSPPPSATAADATQTASADDATHDGFPEDCLAALALPASNSELLRKRSERVIEHFLRQQGDERRQALIADLAGYAPRIPEALARLQRKARRYPFDAWRRYATPQPTGERYLSRREMGRVRTLLATEGVEALIASTDAAVLQGLWNPGTTLVSYLIKEHGDALSAALPAVAKALPVGLHELATAIEIGTAPADFARLLQAADVDPAATWHDSNLAKLAAIYTRPDILRLLTARGVDATARPREGRGAILDDIAASAEPADAASTAALADVVQQLAAAGARPELPSTLRTLAAWLPEASLPPLHPASTAAVLLVADTVATVAAMDADWTRKIEAARRVEQRCDAQLDDFRRAASAFRATDLTPKQRYQEVRRRRVERGRAASRRAAEERTESAADEARRRAVDEMYRTLIDARGQGRWQDFVAAVDQVASRFGGYPGTSLRLAITEAPLEAILQLAERHGPLPGNAIYHLASYRHHWRSDAAEIAEALEPFGLDLHYVDTEGQNAFTGLAQAFLDKDDQWQMAEYLASRSVAVKPRPFGLDPLDVTLRMLALHPSGPGRIRFVRFLLDHGAPVEPSHRELAAQVFLADERVHRRLVEAVPELALRAPDG